MKAFVSTIDIRPQSVLCLGASIGTPVYLGAYLVKGLVYTATGYGPVALVLVGLAVWNILKWRQVSVG